MSSSVPSRSEKPLRAESPGAAPITFEWANALELPYADGAFNLIWTQHSTMNIPDKAGLFVELYREALSIRKEINPPDHPDVGTGMSNLADALARAVIGVAAAAARRVDGESIGVEKLRRVGAGARGVERRMLEQPDQLALGARANRLCPRLHRGERAGIGGEARRDPPFQCFIRDGRQARRSCAAHGACA